jgi:hypothetical protein
MKYLQLNNRNNQAFIISIYNSIRTEMKTKKNEIEFI